ncbi:MATE efflux family protein [Oleispira antarctica RB-8]|uniref:MATE efflux family protein n=1 Tax=Oleispira antarctica RB-8 TaxID=698738 RepID=R4YV75_OLEAN|nr:MATE efflux family protein [Oleispira antarctica RB-8]
MRDEIVSAPVGRVLYKLTLPMVIGIVAVFFFNLVDTYFIALLGTQSLAAVSFTMPIAMIVMNLAIGLGIASSALIARATGSRDYSLAQNYVAATLLLTLATSILMLILGLVFNDDLFLLLGADEDLLPLIWEYMQFWWPGVVVMMLMIVINSSMRAVGNTKLPSIMMLGSAVLNAILDPILIFGFGPIEGMGVAGAALASTLCWLIVVIVMMFSLAKIDLLHWGKLTFKALLSIWQRLMSLGIPAMITNVLVPVASGFLLAMIAPMGEQSIAAFGVGARIEPFAIVAILALTSTIPVFVGQNFAAGRHERIWQALSISVRFILVWQIVVWLALWAISPFLATIFSQDQVVIDQIVVYLMIMPVGYAGMGIVLCANSALNALQKTSVSMLLNLVRLSAFYVPLAWLGGHYYGFEGLLFGASVGNLIAGLIVWVLIRHAQAKEAFGVRNHSVEPLTSSLPAKISGENALVKSL